MVLTMAFGATFTFSTFDETIVGSACRHPAGQLRKMSQPGPGIRAVSLKDSLSYWGGSV